MRAHLRGAWLEGSAFQRALPEHSLGSQVKGGTIPSTHLEVQQLRGGRAVVGKSRFHTSSFPFLIHPFLLRMSLAATLSRSALVPTQTRGDLHPLLPRVLEDLDRHDRVGLGAAGWG